MSRSGSTFLILSALLLSACAGLPGQAPAASPSAACAVPASSATLQVDPLASPTGAQEVDLAIRLIPATGQAARVIARGSDAGTNGVLAIETQSGAFGTNKVKLLPNTTHRLSVTVEYDETVNVPNCPPQTARRKVSTSADVNGLPLVIAQSQSLAGAATPVAPAATAAGDSPVAGPTVAASVPTAVPPPASGGCVDTASFIADVTIPDDSEVAANSALNKVWRVRNAGACAWTGGYSVVRTNASAGFNPPATAAILSVVNPGDSGDVAVAMTAPGTPGLYQAAYRMKGPDGTLFGPALTISIKVPGTATTSCSGTPTIASFTADRLSPTSNMFMLRWGAVTNADRVELDNGIGGVASPGERSITISSNKTYRLTAKCGANSVSREVSLVYNAPVAIVSFAGSWVHNFGTMTLSQSGTTVTGSYVNAMSGASGTINGTVSGNTLSGNWSISGGSGTLQWTINGNAIDGNWNGSNQWCGARSGNAFPAGCGFAGSWVASVAGNSACAMNLTQNGTSVSGSYCNGTLSGSVTYASGYALLSGTWQTGPAGTLKLYLLGYNGDQFQGNWNTSNAWCGRRSSASLPSPCLR